MPDPERNTKTVSQSAIDEIKKLGMPAAIKKYTAGGNSSEFNTAMERYYSPARLKGASKAAVASAGKSGGTASENKTPVDMPPSAPAAATRKVAPKGMAEALGAPSKGGGAKKPKSSAFVAATKSGGGGSVNLGGLVKPKKPSQSSKLKAQLERQKAPQSPTTS